MIIILVLPGLLRLLFVVAHLILLYKEAQHHYLLKFSTVSELSLMYSPSSSTAAAASGLCACVICRKVVGKKAGVSLDRTVSCGVDGAQTMLAFRIFKLLQLEALAGILCTQCFREVEETNRLETRVQRMVARLRSKSKLIQARDDGGKGYEEERLGDVKDGVQEDSFFIHVEDVAGEDDSNLKEEEMEEEAKDCLGGLDTEEEDQLEDEVEEEEVDEGAERPVGGDLPGGHLIYLGRKFKSYAQFEEVMVRYSEATFTNLTTKDTRRHDGHASHRARSVDLDRFPYVFANFCCIHGRAKRTKSTGQRPNQSYKCLDCPYELKVTYRRHLDAYQVRKLIPHHRNHQLTSETYWSAHSFTEEEQRTYIDNYYLGLRLRPSDVIKKIKRDLGVDVTTVQFTNWARWRHPKWCQY